ncbi:hypothetical protein NC653_038750 [Populus alba x Populus x berolinensis]|uniref:Uncharacterized protein n=1 Tax=Populus alba x Populus x berolinensis TaxID=444605 RepID=A0AAD6PTS9_9ROSI|nr:hypothetical protein NC653_038750 [Populus alba x Populus x berolinensis]
MVYRRSAFAFFGYSIFFLDLKSSYSSIVPCPAGSRYHAFSLPDGEDCATYTGSSRSVRSRESWE